MSSEYHRLKPNEMSSYLMTFLSLWYRYKSLPIGDTTVGGMFQRKIDKILRQLLNVLTIALNILIVGSNSNAADHDRILHMVLQMCRKENFKLNKDRSHFR